MPMMPMDPARRGSRRVRPFFVIRLLPTAISRQKPIEVARGFGFAPVFGGGTKGIGVGDDAAVGQLDDAGSRTVGQLGVVRS